MTNYYDLPKEELEKVVEFREGSKKEEVKRTPTTADFLAVVNKTFESVCNKFEKFLEEKSEKTCYDDMNCGLTFMKELEINLDKIGIPKGEWGFFNKHFAEFNDGGSYYIVVSYKDCIWHNEGHMTQLNCMFDDNADIYY